LRVRIETTGLYLPQTVETAEELAPRIGRSVGWIAERTGVLQRRIADEPVEVMAAGAAREALGDGPPPDLVLFAAATPRQLIPDTATFVLRELGLNGVPGWTVHGTCLSFLAALQTAAALVVVGQKSRVLIVSAEIASAGRDLGDPESAALLGDGAAAAVIGPTGDSPSRILAFRYNTWPEGADLTEYRGAGTRKAPNDPATTREDNLFHMNGPRVYRMARPKVAVMVDELLGDAGCQVSDIDLVVPHQASGPAVASLGRLGFPPDRVVDVVGRWGNCIAASLPMALAEAERTGRLVRGTRVLLIGTGAGLSVAGAVLVW
jgi:3-oxoacyl-[acyl-carrier-protein] synthase-3